MTNSDKPIWWGSDELTKFIDMANHNNIATLSNYPIYRRKYIEIHNIFKEGSELLKNTESLLSALLMLKTHCSFLGAVNLVTSGQISEAYMILRGCLESSLYAYFIFKDPSKKETWLTRHDNENTRKQMRKEFSYKNIFPILEAEDGVLSKNFNILYERTIDYGAHPNPKSLLTNMDEVKEGREIIYKLKYLQGNSDSLKLCLKVSAQAGVIVLEIINKIFSERFKIAGITDKIEILKDGI